MLNVLTTNGPGTLIADGSVTTAVDNVSGTVMTGGGRTLTVDGPGVHFFFIRNRFIRN